MSEAEEWAAIRAAAEGHVHSMAGVEEWRESGEAEPIFHLAWMPDGPAPPVVANLPSSYRPFVPDFERGFMVSSDLPPHLDALADAMDRCARRAEHRGPQSRRRKLKLARVNP